MTVEDEKIEMKPLTLEDCRKAMAEIEANGPRGFDPMTQMYLFGLQMGRRKQQELMKKWLEKCMIAHFRGIGRRGIVYDLRARWGKEHVYPENFLPKLVFEEGNIHRLILVNEEKWQAFKEMPIQ